MLREKSILVLMALFSASSYAAQDCWTKYLGQENAFILENPNPACLNQIPKTAKELYFNSGELKTLPENIFVGLNNLDIL